MAKAHAVALGTKLLLAKFGGLGAGAAMFGGLKKVDTAKDVARPIFTSPGKVAAADISKETIPANKVRSQLEGRGVNKDELEWTGFNEWIKTKKGEVSKAEIEEFFAQNQIEVREVVRGGKGSLTETQMQEIATNEVFHDITTGYRDQIIENILKKQEKSMPGGVDDSAVKAAYESKYSRPWGELPLTSKEGFARTYRIDNDLPGQAENAFDDAAWEYDNLIRAWSDSSITEAEMSQLNQMMKEADAPDIEALYGNTLAEIESGEYSLEHLNIDGAELQTKFSSPSWQLPGGENYRELLLIVPPKKVPWTKENVTEVVGGGLDHDNFYFFKTPDGLKKIPKQQNVATDYLGDGFKGQIVFDDPIKVDDFLININAAGVSEELRYGRLGSDDLVVQFDNLPNEEFNLFKKNAEELGGSLRGVDEATSMKVPPNKAVNQEEAFQEVLTRQPDPKPRYTGGHFEENDVVAHIRFNERVDPDGNKVLFIEEIQGDWAHKGQEKGFGNLLDAATTDKLKKELAQKQAQFEDVAEKYFKGISEPGREQNDLLHQINVSTPSDFAKYLGIPNDEASTIFNLPMEMGALNNRLQGVGQGSGVARGPFVTDTHQWTNLALKRMIRWGSDNGFDSIAWVTGKQSADRYKVSKTVDSIYWNPESTRLTAIEKGSNNIVLNEFVPENKLADYIGKEPANRLLKSPKNKDKALQQFEDGLITENERNIMVDSHSLEGADLDIGGEYHKLIYDQVLTAQAKKIGKKHGAKVEQKAPFEPDMSALEKEWNELSAKRNEHLRFDTEFTPEDERRLEEVVNQMDFTDSDADIIGNVWTMPLTDKLKNAAKDGMPYYVALPPLVMGAAAQRTDAQRQQSKSDAQAILAN